MVLPELKLKLKNHFLSPFGNATTKGTFFIIKFNNQFKNKNYEYNK